MSKRDFAPEFYGSMRLKEVTIRPVFERCHANAIPTDGNATPGIDTNYPASLSGNR